MNEQSKLIGNFFTVTVLALALVACGAGGSPTASQPTVTPFPTYQYIPPTEAPIIVTIGVMTATAGSKLVLDPDTIALGKSRYEALDCGSCHGVDGKGTDNGPALAGTKLSEDDFINMLRSGGKLGNKHLFSTDRLSESGGKNLYVYILSLDTTNK